MQLLVLKTSGKIFYLVFSSLKILHLIFVKVHIENSHWRTIGKLPMESKQNVCGLQIYCKMINLPYFLAHKERVCFHT